MIEAQALPERTASLNALLARRKEMAMLAPVASPSRALAIIDEQPAAGWAEDLRFFAICYLAGLIFFLIMLT